MTLCLTRETAATAVAAAIGVPLSVQGRPVHALRRPFPADPIAPECNPQYRGRDDPQGKAGAGAHALWKS